MRKIIILFLFTTGSLSAQVLSEDSLILQGWRNHPSIRAAEMNTSAIRSLNSTSNEIPKTEILISTLKPGNTSKKFRIWYVGFRYPFWKLEFLIWNLPGDTSQRSFPPSLLKFLFQNYWVTCKYSCR